MSRAPEVIRADWAARGFESVQARLVISDLMRHPAYADAKHPQHREVIAETRWLYGAITPEADA